MLKCNEVTRQASDYLDHTLNWRQRLAIHVHTAMCVHCRRFVNHLALTIRVGSVLGREEARTAEVEQVVERVFQPQQPPHPR